MKPLRSTSVLAILCATAGMLANTVAADEPQAQVRAPSAGIRIALLNEGEVAKQHPLYPGMWEALNEQDRFNREQAREKRIRMDELNGQIKDAQGGTDLKQLQEEFDRLELDSGSGFTADQRTDATAVLVRVWADIRQATARYCRDHDISLVLRRMPDVVDEEEPGTIRTRWPMLRLNCGMDVVDEEGPGTIRGMIDRLVLYQVDLDITDAVCREMQRDAGQ